MDLTGVVFETQVAVEATEKIKTISSNIETIMKDFQDTLTILIGSGDSTALGQIRSIGEFLIKAVSDLCECILRLGVIIGDFIKMLISRDSDIADRLYDKIMN